MGTASRGPVEGLCRFSPRVHHLVDRLCDVVAPSQHCLEIETSQRHVHHYLAGLLSHLERTKAEESAALVDVERLVMQECSGTAPWDHRLLVTVLVGQGVDRLGAPDEVLVFNSRSYPKRGVHSVGVKRPWGGHRGKVITRQVGVSMASIARQAHAVLDFRLFGAGGTVAGGAGSGAQGMSLPGSQSQTGEEPSGDGRVPGAHLGRLALPHGVGSDHSVVLDR